MGRAVGDAWKLVGGRTCLDFTNTVGGRVRAPGAAGGGARGRVVREKLRGYEDMLAWGRSASVLSRTEADRLERSARRDPKAAAAVHARGLRLREALYGIGKAIAKGRRLEAEDVRVLDGELEVARAHQRLVPRAGRLEAELRPGPRALDGVLWSVALSAAELFASRDVDRLRQCGGVECGWLFLDRSRNRRRRWCDMRDCGNLAKVRRFRLRRKRSG